ncbi:MAG: META domain-containing protein [Thiohalocapsa sp.]|nr:META domain-containing protein [Thiohalocapsa sp.]MCF7990852.1 META domain-containing protein [Thiohalocapsa sp.]
MNARDLLRTPAAALLAVVAALAGTMSACATDTMNDAETTLEGTQWRIETYRADGAMQPILGGENAVVSFDDGRFSGSAGCNRLMGGYSIDGGTLKMTSQMASTMMACDPPLMEQERAVVDAISRAARYRIDGGRLEILDAGGEPLLTLAELRQASLTGTQWQLVSLNNGKQAIVSTLVGADVTLQFDADGRFSGQACNRYRGAYALNGNWLEIREPVATTRMMCPSPEGVMAQEAAYLDALTRVVRYEISGSGLTLFDGNASRLAVFVAASEEQ